MKSVKEEGGGVTELAFIKAGHVIVHGTYQGMPPVPIYFKPSDNACLKYLSGSTYLLSTFKNETNCVAWSQINHISYLGGGCQILIISRICLQSRTLVIFTGFIKHFKLHNVVEDLGAIMKVFFSVGDVHKVMERMKKKTSTRTKFSQTQNYYVLQ